MPTSSYLPESVKLSGLYFQTAFHRFSKIEERALQSADSA